LSKLKLTYLTYPVFGRKTPVVAKVEGPKVKLFGAAASIGVALEPANMILSDAFSLLSGVFR
jgi:hypothetical protein